MEQENAVKMQADEFQDSILRAVEQHPAPYLIKLRGLDYAMFPSVFNPNYAKPALFLLENLGVKKGDVVLDPFTGSGADAVFAALEGASKVVAIDKFTMPFLCTKYNVEQLGLADKIDVRQGDLFEPLEAEEKFDLIVANPPFREMNSKTSLESAMRDDGYETLKRFFRQAKNHLKENGRIRLVFADVGDMSFLEKLAAENGFESKIVAQTLYASSVRIHVYEMTVA
ncbi:tRNA (adenine(22)-N(1))-methyltransferase TrmK [Candidatus Micrarchaeota archaeon]|nr:tRNA (adenine(22)-N(1))-methyltransferase TrmK [Candidatus Micrarchaeota archaeon]